MRECRQELDQLAAQVIEAGLAYWDEGHGTLHLRGQATLLDDINEMAHLSSIRCLFETLETQEMMLKLLHSAQDSDGGAHLCRRGSELFDLSGVSMVVAPARGKNNRIVGAIGVIGPTRLNYGRCSACRRLYSENSRPHSWLMRSVRALCLEAGYETFILNFLP